jgi:hypothetical protein
MDCAEAASLYLISMLNKVTSAEISDQINFEIMQFFCYLEAAYILIQAVVTVIFQIISFLVELNNRGVIIFLSHKF